jgi:hypothetical protein
MPSSLRHNEFMTWWRWGLLAVSVIRLHGDTLTLSAVPNYSDPHFFLMPQVNRRSAAVPSQAPSPDHLPARNRIHRPTARSCDSAPESAYPGRSCFGDVLKGDQRLGR